MRILALALVLSGCTLSFQPYGPEIGREEVTAAFSQRDQNIQALAEAISKLKAEEKKK